MFKRNLIAVWFGIIVLSGMFLMGQDDWPPQTDPCVPDPCATIENATVGTCSAIDGTDFTCSCDSGYTWQSGTHACEYLLPACDRVVDFPDPNLEQAIRAAIGKLTGDIYGADLLGLTYRDAYKRHISDLSGLECCTALTLLGLWDNQIVNVSPLAGLINLTQLDLASNQIVDICPLVENSGLDSGDSVSLLDNPLSATSCTVCIPQLETRNVDVHHDCP